MYLTNQAVTYPQWFDDIRIEPIMRRTRRHILAVSNPVTHSIARLASRGLVLWGRPASVNITAAHVFKDNVALSAVDGFRAHDRQHGLCRYWHLSWIDPPSSWHYHDSLMRWDHPLARIDMQVWVLPWASSQAISDVAEHQRIGVMCAYLSSHIVMHPMMPSVTVGHAPPLTQPEAPVVQVRSPLAGIRWRREAAHLITRRTITTPPWIEAADWVEATPVSVVILINPSLATTNMTQDHCCHKPANRFHGTLKAISATWQDGATWTAKTDRPKGGENVAKRHQSETQTRCDGVCRQRTDHTCHHVGVHGMPMHKPCHPNVTAALADMTACNRMADTAAQTPQPASPGMMAAGIAHEIRNPIGIMLLAADEAKDALHHAGDPDTIAACLETIVAEGVRCQTMVQSLLQCFGREPVNRRPGHLNPVIRSAVEQTRAYAAAHGVQLDLALANALPLVLMHATVLEHVFINLIRNGIEAGACHIHVQSQAADGSVRCAVQDNGRGMDADALDHVFDPFYTTRRPTGGTGLGLSLVHNMIEAHQGAIEVESQSPRGTTFTVSLPTLVTGGEQVYENSLDC